LFVQQAGSKGKSNEDAGAASKMDNMILRIILEKQKAEQIATMLPNGCSQSRNGL
jgi:hypothetical protein